MESIDARIEATRTVIDTAVSKVEAQEELVKQSIGSDQYMLQLQILASLVADKAAVQKQLAELLAQQSQLLAQQAADEYGCIVTKGALAKLKRCTFVISSSSESSDTDVTTPKSTDGSDSNSKGYSAVGVGVFVTKNKAVTAAHNLDTDHVVGSTVRVVLPEVKTELVLRVHVRDDVLDIAVLEFDGEHEHLDLYTGQVSTLVGQRLAMCSYMLGVEEELEEFSRTMAVSAAYVNKESRHGNHIVYQSNAWPGDSGAAVVLREGQLLGVHVAGVNALREKFEKKHSIAERLNAVEESLEAAARSTASGCIAVTVKAFEKLLE